MCLLTANGKGCQWAFHYIQPQEPSPPPPPILPTIFDRLGRTADCDTIKINSVLYNKENSINIFPAYFIMLYRIF